jgi:hypothetical protein
MPVVKQDDLPSSQASVIGAVQFGGFRCMVGHTHGVIAVEQTSMPARRKRDISLTLSSACAAVGP